MTDSGARGATETAQDAVPVKYQTETTKVVRGTEKLFISKREADGWELVSQTPGTLRTELVFRKPAPKAQWKLYAILGGVLVVLGVFIGIMAAITGEEEDKSAAPTASTSAEPVAPRDEPSAEPEEPITPSPAEAKTLTIENSEELAALLADPAEGSTVEAFAQKYAGQLIEFDGAIGAMANHEGYTTRYDMLIVSGDYSETHSNGGPSFQFRDVNITNDLHLTGDVPDTVGVGTNVHVIARVGSFKTRCFCWSPWRPECAEFCRQARPIAQLLATMEHGFGRARDAVSEVRRRPET